jgi:hypothetical protein
LQIDSSGAACVKRAARSTQTFDGFVMLTRLSLIAIVICSCSSQLAAQRRHAISSARVIPVCSKPSDTEKIVGFDIKFIVPKDTEIIHGGDIDFVAWAINFRAANKSPQLAAFKGLNVGNGEPERADIDASRKLTRRYWSHNKHRGADSRGTLKNGNFWRNFGMFGEVIWYHNVPADAVAYFDRIIDTACFPN